MRLVAPAVLCLLLASSGPAGARRCGDDVDGRAVPCDCGDVLVASRTLGADDAITSRVCPGSGLLVDAPPDRAVTLTLAGHALAGSGRGFGIEVLGGSGVAIVGPGAVRGFERGLLATRGGLARLADVTAAENASDGFDLAGDGYVVSGCEALRNGRDGFALGGVRYRVEGNRALENRRYGFALSGRDAGIGGTSGNEAAGNGRDGLRVRGRDHVVERAVATANGGHGVSARVAGGRITGAAATANRGVGVRAAGTGLVATGNEARENRRGIELRGAGAQDGCLPGPGCR